jgi:type II secretory pathway component GspD/PulD (secretin)
MVRAVVLKVQVLDVQLNKSNQFGINWNSVFTSAFKNNPFGLNAVSIGANLIGGAGITDGSPSIQFSNASGSNTALVTALTSQGKVNVISNPTLMLLNGETRTISSNQISSYVKSVDTTTNGLTSSSTYPIISQVSVGLSISFTPHINAKTGVITVTVNFLDNGITGYNNFNIGGNTFNNPIISTKSISDTVRVLNNHIAIMGGILTSNKSNTNYGIPILSKIPILGLLFQGQNDTLTKDDLVIMITPKIVKF